MSDDVKEQIRDFILENYLFTTDKSALGLDDSLLGRGIVDSTGFITGQPGMYLGSRQVALSTDMLGRTTYQPGFRVELGYKFDDGLQLYANYMQLFDAGYSAGATLATPYARRMSGETLYIDGGVNIMA